MKKGDHVVFTAENKHWLYGGVSAYAPFEGKVLDVWEDNSFSIERDSGILICLFDKHKKIHVILNGKSKWIRRKREYKWLAKSIKQFITLWKIWS